MAPPQQPDVLCIGETMALVAPVDGESLARTRHVQLTHAGAESNVARHLVDLGFRPAWVSAVGDDALGQRLVEDLGAAGVDVRWVDRRPAPTGVFFKDPSAAGTRVLYYRSGSAASTLAPADIDGWPLAAARWLHLTGITTALSTSCAALVDALFERAAAAGLPVSFDVNYRPPLWADGAAPARLLELAQRAHVVLVGLDEAESLWGTSTAQEVAELIDTPPTMVVKDGDREAVEFQRAAGNHARVTRVPARQAHVVEPVGAGDAFAAGYLAAHLRGADAEGRLELGHSLAAWTLGTTADYRPDHGPVARPRTDDIEEHR